MSEIEKMITDFLLSVLFTKVKTLIIPRRNIRMKNSDILVDLFIKITFSYKFVGK